MRIDINRLATMARAGVALVQANPVQAIAITALAGGTCVAVRNKKKVVKAIGVGVAALAAVNLAQTKAVQEGAVSIAKMALKEVSNHPVAAAVTAVVFATPQGREAAKTVARAVVENPVRAAVTLAAVKAVYKSRDSKVVQAVVNVAKDYPGVATVVAATAAVLATPQGQEAVAKVVKKAGEVAKQAKTYVKDEVVEPIRMEWEGKNDTADLSSGSVEESEGGFWGRLFSGLGGGLSSEDWDCNIEVGF